VARETRRPYRLHRVHAERMVRNSSGRISPRKRAAPQGTIVSSRVHLYERESSPAHNHLPAGVSRPVEISSALRSGSSVARSARSGGSTAKRQHGLVNPLDVVLLRHPPSIPEGMPLRASRAAGTGPVSAQRSLRLLAYVAHVDLDALLSSRPERSVGRPAMICPRLARMMRRKGLPE
jgi:hypothetical protein